jgi:O-methyltransferase
MKTSSLRCLLSRFLARGRAGTHPTARYWPTQLGFPQTAYETDEGFHLLYDRAQEKTQMLETDNPLRRQRQYVLMQLLQQCKIEQGDVVELGVWRGLSAYQIATHLMHASQEKTEFHIFDSFEGLSEITPVDKATHLIQDAEQIRKRYACSQDIVQANLAEFDFITYHKGWIPEGFERVQDRLFSFVHIDVDLYQPIRDSFLFFYPRLVPNGVMVLDDYGSLGFPGAKLAIDECLQENGGAFFVKFPAGNAMVMRRSSG